MTDEKVNIDPNNVNYISAEVNKFSILRNMDRIRILDIILDNIIRIKSLKKNELFLGISIKRDMNLYKPYKM
jgi:hypothetical protein